jgi:hypothetical protein
VLCALVLGCARPPATTTPTPTPTPFDPKSTAASLELDHLWIVVSQGAPERAVLERAGLAPSPKVNRHDGQGTASITFDFQNAYLELLWPDETVPVAAGLERVVHKFRQRMEWRTSGWSPIGIGMRRTTTGGEASLELPTWSITPGWLPPGAAIEMLTPRDDTTSPSLFVMPPELVSPEATSSHHPLGVERVTAVRLITPSGYQPIEALRYVTRAGVLQTGSGEAWLAQLTFDGGARGQSKDLRPELPLVLRY